MLYVMYVMCVSSPIDSATDSLAICPDLQLASSAVSIQWPALIGECKSQLPRLSAEGLADLGAYLLAPDHGAMDLLHALPWDSILAALAPAVRPRASLDGQPQQWATQLALLALQCMVLLPQSQLPSWLLDLAHPLSKPTLIPSPAPVGQAHILSICLHQDDSITYYH